MTIREYAKKVGFNIVGKLIRHPEKEYETNWTTGEKYNTNTRFYLDEAGNEYYINKRNVCIVTINNEII